MRREQRIPIGPGFRLSDWLRMASMITMLGLLVMLMLRFRDPSLWCWVGPVDDGETAKTAAEKAGGEDGYGRTEGKPEPRGRPCESGESWNSARISMMKRPRASGKRSRRSKTGDGPTGLKRCRHITASSAGSGGSLSTPASRSKKRRHLQRFLPRSEQMPRQALRVETEGRPGAEVRGENSRRSTTSRNLGLAGQFWFLAV